MIRKILMWGQDDKKATFPRRRREDQHTHTSGGESGTDDKKDEIVPTLIHQVPNTNLLGAGEMSIVVISDTHGDHRKLDMPPTADLLIHAGDFTLYGKKEQVEDFNSWLGELPYRHKIVVNGNHECNAVWKGSVKKLLSNAIFLKNEFLELTDIGEGNNNTLRIYGMDFSWPCLGGNPAFEQIEMPMDILISHCPADGFVDNKMGCPALTQAIFRLKPRLVISGHIHNARGVATSQDGEITFINAATARGGHSFGQQPIIIQFVNADDSEQQCEENRATGRFMAVRQAFIDYFM